MLDLSPWYQARDHMVDALVADLYGTDSDLELLEEPLQRFIVGILHPQSEASAPRPVVAAANEVPEAEMGTEVDADYDPGVSFANLRYPASMGLTCGVSADTQQLVVRVSACRYKPIKANGAPQDPSPAEKEQVASRAYSRRINRWQQRPPVQETVQIPIAPGTTDSIEVAEGLALRVVQRPNIDGVINTTVVLVNTFIRPEQGLVDDICWFRPELVVESAGGTFVDRRPPELVRHLDHDEESGELLYRHQRSLAVGHGVAVDWAQTDSVTRLWTTFFPRHDLRLAQADRDDVPGLEMSELARPGIYEPLYQLVDQYESWIKLEENKIHSLAPRHQKTAERHIREARDAATRMREGVAVLMRDEGADRAFRIMNEVMQHQRVRQEMVRRGLAAPPAEVVGAWRPFQMAFILLNITGLCEPSSEDRRLADLLWFSTGGGKTEAYLGLIAFTLVLRRLRRVGVSANGAGVGVIMRYTLRLLTLQQFERAASLICALENWRRTSLEGSSWAPFSVGLWVGRGATPNNIGDAARAIRKRQNNEDPGDYGDPVQLLNCPWCGTELSPHDYFADKIADRLQVRCPNVSSCEFAQVDGLPVHLIDTDVYRECPSLVIGTVDKFAMLAWNEHSGNLFGGGQNPPPDLIVQDELHLISGPLGTLVGLYETAIDHLATNPGTGAPPKIVASTATIRRATHQMRAVFNRNARQFPPPGIDADDSFFSVDAPPEIKGTRRYVGLMAPGTSHATLLVRTYAALLQAGQDLQASDEVKDAYWTILGYFNSLRVLGAAYIQSIDDVRDRIKVVAKRNGTQPRDLRDPRELTSRKNSSEIPEELKALTQSFPEANAADIVLATNMISVGVDIDRLGLMAIMGQPQTTSEYIQATSRVGRQRPGLVFTIYNSARSRDLSHYESFIPYHRTLYKQVEATGATPFAPRALDRGLHGLLVILARHTLPGARADSAVNVPPRMDKLDDVVDLIVHRAADVDPSSALEVREALETLIEHWRWAASDGELKQYAQWWPGPTKPKGLLAPAGKGDNRNEAGDLLAEIFPPGDPPWSTLTSLRNVDRESTLRVISIRRTKEAISHDGK